MPGGSRWCHWSGRRPACAAPSIAGEHEAVAGPCILETAMTHPALHDGGLQIFDVDHGQCALLTVPAVGRTAYRVLVDCGHAVNFRGAPWYPGEHLQGLGVNYVDMLVCTNL